ncbi:TerD family protein [Priestia koreensis]|uniref:TerD family protein n=1 Tax=Priestia koreensis TaxID=284581 RepID=UPI003D066400
MAISLTKGQKIDLTKGQQGLSKLLVGLGWDPVKKKSFLGFGGGGANIDCDASVLMLDEDGKLRSQRKVIYFGNRESACQSIRHSGDNLTGHGDGDDEQIFVDLEKVPSIVHKLVFVVNIYDADKRHQDFGMIQNAFIRIVDASSNNELVHYNITDNFSGLTTLFAGELYRHGGEWKFSAVGEGTKDISISQVASKYS